jgi:hypothetical protein
MANKKISELTAKAATLEDTDLLMVADYNGATYDTKSVTGANIRPWFTILLSVSQTSTFAPTVGYSYKEIAQTLTWARTSAGVYTLTASSACFTVNKTYVHITAGANTGLTCFTAIVTSTTVITINTSNSSTGALVDDALNSSILEIKIIK